MTPICVKWARRMRILISYLYCLPIYLYIHLFCFGNNCDSSVDEGDEDFYYVIYLFIYFSPEITVTPMWMKILFAFYLFIYYVFLFTFFQK